MTHRAQRLEPSPGPPTGPMRPKPAPSVRRVLAWLLAVLVTLGASGCAEFLDELEILSFEQSPDPAVRMTGELMREQQQEKQVDALITQYVETRDPALLEQARAIRPGDAVVQAYDLVLLQQARADRAAIEAAEEALAVTVARQIGSTGGVVRSSDVKVGALRRVMLVQVRLLGGTFGPSWVPRPPDADGDYFRLYADFCDTIRALKALDYDPAEVHNATIYCTGS